MPACQEAHQNRQNIPPTLSLVGSASSSSASDTSDSEPLETSNGIVDELAELACDPMSPCLSHGDNHEPQQPASPQVDLQDLPPHPKCVWIEEVEDEEVGEIPKKAFIQDYPNANAGSNIKINNGTEKSKFTSEKTSFEKLHEKLRNSAKEKTLSLWHSFESKEEWALMQWLMGSGLSQMSIDKYLKLEIVCTSEVLL